MLGFFGGGGGGGGGSAYDISFVVQYRFDNVIHRSTYLLREQYVHYLL